MVENGMKQSGLMRLIAIAALGCAMAACALMTMRIFGAISFFEPLQAGTKGAEYESLFAIWKVIFGGTLYADQNQIPFSGTYYNWLFYHFYAWVTELILDVFALDARWLPTITRLLSFSGLLVGGFIMYRSMVELLQLDDVWLKRFALMVSIFVFFGPLIGFFGVSTIPDIWPLVLTVGGVWVFVRGYEVRPLLTIFAVIALSYLCWAFKQNFLILPASVGLYLLLARRWRDAALLTVGCITLAVFTLIAGDDVYRKMLYFVGSHVFLSGWQLKVNAINFATKSVPFLVSLPVLLWLVAPSIKPWVRKALHGGLPPHAVIACGTFVTLCQSLLTSSVIYAAENHYYFFSYFAAFSTVGLTVVAYRANTMPLVAGVIQAAAWGAQTVAVLMVITGFAGIVSVRPVHDQLVRVHNCLGPLPEPAFVANPYLALPWLTDVATPFVVHMNYSSDRAAGVEKEAGGIGGLIDNGYFKTLVLPQGVDYFDGSALMLYEKQRACDVYDVYERTAKPAGGS